MEVGETRSSGLSDKRGPRENDAVTINRRNDSMWKGVARRVVLRSCNARRCRNIPLGLAAKRPGVVLTTVVCLKVMRIKT